MTKPNNPHLDVPAIPGFHAVDEARKWKEAVSLETKDMSAQELMDYFNSRIEKYPKTRER